MFFAEHDGVNAEPGVFAPWKKMSVGFVGTSDGWQDLSQHFRDGMGVHARRERKHCFHRRRSIWRHVTENSCSPSASEPSGPKLASKRDPVSSKITTNLRAHYISQWKNWQTKLLPLDQPLRQNDLYRSSTAVLRTHESKDFLGGIIASLSIPWGFNKGDEDLGGYHLVWPRDLVETAGALLAAGAPLAMPPACSAISKRRRKRTAIGRKICGSTDVLTGAASRWTKPPFPSC